MTSDGDRVPCRSCGGATNLIEHMARIGQEAGARVFRCVSCDALTWTPVTPSAPQAPEN